MTSTKIAAPAPPGTTFAVLHPDAAVLLAVPGFFRAAATGKWGAVAELCAPMLLDPSAAARDLDALAGGAGVTFAQSTSLEVRSVEGGVLFSGSRRDLLGALDVFSRVPCGQWDSVADAASVQAGDMIDRRVADSLLSFRLEHQRTFPLSSAGFTTEQRDTSFPMYRNSSWGIAQATLPAQVAYHAYKLLGGGSPGAPTFAIGTSEMSVVSH